MQIAEPMMRHHKPHKGINMKKRSIFSRIAILNEGRKAFLDYLRNIAPQAILLSFSLFSTYKSSLLPQHETGLIFLALSFLATFAAAWYANISMFYQECFKGELQKYNKRIHQLCNTLRYSRSQRLIIVAILMIKNKRVELIEQGCTVVILQITLVALILLAGQNYSHMLPLEK